MPASQIPLVAFVYREKVNTFKKDLLLFRFHIERLEFETSNFAVNLIEAGMFFYNAAFMGQSDLLKGFFFEVFSSCLEIASLMAG